MVLMQERKPICYHAKLFFGSVMNYPTYDKELYAYAEAVKKWKCWLHCKETIIHTDHNHYNISKLIKDFSKQGTTSGWDS
jgi:hypothetical protein